MLGLGFALTFAPLHQLGWSPQLLFQAGGGGLWLDPSQLATLSENSAGSVPVAAAGQPVGRVLDLSGAGRHAVQGTSSARPTYRVDGNGRPYLEFDGIDDSLAVASFAMAASGRSLMAALRKRSDATAGAVVEIGTSWSAAAGGAALFAPSYGNSTTFGTRAMPAAEQSTLHSGSGFPAPQVAVITATSTGGSHVFRVNGQVMASAAPAGPMAALTAPVNIGARNGNQLYAAMDLYGLILLDRVLTAPELALAEAWMAAKCGGVL